MTKYIGKKIIVSIMILLAAGFVLFILICCGESYINPLVCLFPDRHIVVRYGDDLYFYEIDRDARYMSFHYFIPVNVGSTLGDEIYLPGNSPEYDFDAKYYISPFTRHHIIKRYGLIEQVYTLHSTQKLS